MTPEQQAVLYHVADQALAHTENHEDVGRVDLRLTYIAQHVALTVHDDGNGCRCQEHGQDNYELEDIHACARLMGGHLCVDNQEDAGTTIALWMPLQQ